MSAQGVDTAEWSQAIESHIARGAPLVAAIRLASGPWLTGLLWEPELLVTASGALPAQQAYTAVVGGSEMVAAQALRRNSTLNIAVLKLVGAGPGTLIKPAGAPETGDVVLVLESGPAFAPGGRLSVVRDRQLVLDSPPGYLAEGGPVINAAGGLVGLCVSGRNGEPRIVTYETIARFCDGPGQELAPRGWIGASLQPVTLPKTVRAAARQNSGRLVVNVLPGSPADQAGLRNGDVLLALDGIAMNGRGSLRSLLGPDRFGRAAEVLFVRNGRFLNAMLTVIPQPV